MNVERIHILDRRFGRPLTFLLTLARKIRLRFSRPAPVQPRRVLFIGLSGTGTAILADPALKKARDRLGAEVFFVLFRKNRSGLELLATVRPNRIRTIRENNVFLLVLDSLRFFFWARRQRIDTVIDLELFCRFTALLCGLCGATNRAGFYRYGSEGLYRGDLLTHRVTYNPHLHIAKNYVALVNSLLAPEVELPYSKQAVADEEIGLPVLGYHETELANMHELVRRHFPAYERTRHRLVLVGPNSADPLPQRRWPPECYAELIQRILAADPDLLVLITGTAAEHSVASDVRNRVNHGRCVNIAGSVQPAQLPVLATVAALLVTSDCGTVHFTAITGLPTIVLYGPETPHLYGSLGKSIPIAAGLACSPCLSAANHRTTLCRDNRCMQAISVDQVFAAVASALVIPKDNKRLSA